MIEMFTQKTQSNIITKVKVHPKIAGNDCTDHLAKFGNKLPHRSSLHSYEKAHPTPYYFHRDHWPFMDQTPDKGLLHHFQPYLQKYEKEHSCAHIAQNFPNIRKWTSDKNIDIETFTSFWDHPNITYSQKLASSNFDIINTWIMRIKIYSLVPLYTQTSYAQYVPHQNQTHGNTYYSHVLNNIYMPSKSKDIIMQSGKYADYLSNIRLHDATR
jgi:hypothetical protein